MPAIAHAYAGMTWLLVLADAAIDARHRTCLRRLDMAAGFAVADHFITIFTFQTIKKH